MTEIQENNNYGILLLSTVAVVGIAIALYLKIRPRRVMVMHGKDLNPGQMRTVEVGDNKVLMVRTKKGEFRALGAKCTHYGLPLEKGVLNDDRVVCPFHAACFNVHTGDIEDGPVLDPLPTFKTTVVGTENGGKVYVELPKTDVLPRRREPHMCPASSSDRRNFVIVGAGPAGLAAAQTLREIGYAGQITMLTREANPPYDRPKLSKNLSIVVDGVILRSREWFVKNGISLLTLTDVLHVNSSAHTVTVQALTEDGSPREDARPRDISYDKILCATGGFARRFVAPEPFTIPGADLKNIFPLRDANHSQAIDKALKSVGDRNGGVDVVIVGSSFIGMEAASYLANKIGRGVRSVHVIGQETQPFERVLGVQVGETMRRLAESARIEFHMNNAVAEFVSDDEGEYVTAVQLNRQNVELAADLVIVGAGIIPSTAYLTDAQDVTVDRGAIEVDEHMCAAPDVYAAGDVAKFPYKYATDSKWSKVRIEHWDVAYDQGRCAARNMLGISTVYDKVPFFWTQMFGRSLRYAGNCMEWSDIIVHGELTGDKPECVVYFVSKENTDKVAAVLTVNKDPYTVAALELIRNGRMPSASRLRNQQVFDLPQYLYSL